MPRFALTILLVCGGLGGLTLLAVQKQWIPAKPSFLVETLVFLGFGSILTFRFLTGRPSSPALVQRIVSITALRLLAYAVYNLLMVLEDRSGAAANVVFFMIAYLLCTVIEIGFLFREKPPSGGPEAPSKNI